MTKLRRSEEDQTTMAEKPKATDRVRYGCTSWIVAPLMSYPRNTWSSWALTPLWILQMFLMTNSVITIGILCFEVEGQGTRVDLGWIVALAFVFICILLTAAEIGLWFVRALHPWTYLGLQIFKSIFWILYFAIGIATTVVQRVIDSSLIWPIWKWWQAAGMSASLAITIAALIYGSVVVHKYRRSGLIADMSSENKTYRKEEESDLSERPSSWSSYEISREGKV